VSTPAEDAALDALAAALAPRMLRLLREQAGAEDGLEDLLAQAGFEIDSEANDVKAPPTEAKPARAARKRRAA
jgi:hypothetical protein